MDNVTSIAGKPLPPQLAGHVIKCNDEMVFISRVDLTDEELFNWLLEALKLHGTENPKIRSLLLQAWTLPENGAERIEKELLPYFPNVGNFDVSDTKLGDDGAEIIAKGLEKHCPQLDRAAFPDTDITDRGWFAICRHLPNTNLTEIDVQNNSINSIPAEFARFGSLERFDNGNNPWEGEWECTEDEYGDVGTALAFAKKLAEEAGEDVMVKPAQ